MPRRSPSPSSPTSATNVMVPGVSTWPSFNARITASMTASPRQSSPMPGAFHDVALARDFDVGAFREDGVEVRGEHQIRPRGLAGPHADHVAGRVDAYVAQSEFLEQALQLLSADRFLEGRRGNLAEARLKLEGARLVALCGVHGGAHGGVVAQFRRRLTQAGPCREINKADRNVMLQSGTGCAGRARRLSELPSPLWHHCGTVKEEAALRKELGLGDLVLAQVLCVVGSSWVGVAAKLGRAHVVFWLVAMLAFYLPLAAVVIYLNRLMPLGGRALPVGQAGLRRDGGLPDRVEPVGLRRGRRGRHHLRGADGPRIHARPRVGVAGGQPLGDAHPDRRA